MNSDINLFIDEYLDKELTSYLYLDGIKKAAYLKKTAVRIFFSLDTLIKNLENESKKIVIVITESKIKSEKLLWVLNNKKIHPIFINFQFSDSIYSYSRIIPNYFSSHYCLASKVLEKYPEPSAIVGYNEDSISDNRHRAGFTKAIEEYGVKNAIYYNYGNIEQCIDKVMINIKEYKNLFCCNDILAFFIIQRLKRAGIDPNNYNITGSGNMALGLYTKPSISTVAVDCYGMGAMAVEIYMFLYKKNHVDHLFIDMESQIIFRQSTHLMNDHQVVPSEPVPKGDIIDFFGNEDIIRVNILERTLESCDQMDINIIKGLLKEYTYEEICELNNLAVNTLKYKIKRLEKNLKIKSRKELLDYFHNYDLDF